MNLRTRITILLAAASLAACASSPAARIEDHRAAYDSYPPEVRSKIAAGEIDVGFTMEQVQLALGKPDRRFTRTTESGSAEVWAYTHYTGPHLSFGIGTGFGLGSSGFGSVGVGSSTGPDNPEDRVRVVFVDGKVDAVERALK